MKSNVFKFSIPLAIIITLMAVIYQRSTGPTYPKKFKLEYHNQKAKIKFPRSQGGEINAPIELPLLTENQTATLTYKRFPTNDDWTSIEFNKHDNRLYAELPFQPPAGKLQYFVDINYGDTQQSLGSKTDPVLIRYKGEVPTFVLAPHIAFMFLSMLLAALAGIEAIFKTKSYVKVTQLTTFSLMFGGMFLGPIVQKYAFGVYWAGFPFDWDLTDNKLLIGVIVWLLATATNWSKRRPIFVILAAIALIGVYSIPHSMMGSQYNYEQGKVETDK